VTKTSLHVLHTLLHMDVEYLLHLLATAHTTPHREFGVLHMCATPTVHIPRPLPRPQGRKRVGGIHPLPSLGSGSRLFRTRARPWLESGRLVTHRVT
jgi:hypothetical protein